MPASLAHGRGFVAQPAQRFDDPLLFDDVHRLSVAKLHGAMCDNAFAFTEAAQYLDLTQTSSTSVNFAAVRNGVFHALGDPVLNDKDEILCADRNEGFFRDDQRLSRV
ncbi:MAG TPA: hypothetical protein DHK64_09400, partial [Rhodobiaceae bacterium]|nr:hypothetical protein [Rhodobiaceae bacterium]